MSRKRNPRVSTSDSEPFSALRGALLALPATRAGFEGLVGGLLETATDGRIRLLSSGEQGGVDGVSDPVPGTPRRAFQAKRYRTESHLSLAALRVEMDRAVHSFSALETYVLATTKCLRAAEAEALRRHAQSLGMGLVLLDWDASASRLPVLGVLAAALPEVARDYVKGKRALADLQALRDHENFDAAYARLARALAGADLGFGGAREAASGLISTVFHDPAAARRIAGASPRFLAEAPPVDRPSVEAAVEGWWESAAPHAVLLGREGSGKTWSALSALHDLATAPDGPAPLVVNAAGARRRPDGLAAVVAVLTEAAEAQGVHVDDAAHFWSRRLELWAEARSLSEPPQLLLVVDGLDEAPEMDWGLWLAPLLEKRWNGLFRLLVTCREEAWSHAIANSLAQAAEYQILRVGDFTEAERDAYLTGRNVDLEALSPETARAALHPRTAFHLSRLAEKLPDVTRITREQLLLADFSNLWEVKAHTALTALEFEALVREMALEARDAALRQTGFSMSPGEIRRRAGEVSAAGERDLPQILNELLSGAWCRRDPADPVRLTFQDELLPAAVGMALARHLRRPGGEVTREVEAFLEPWGADDLSERMLRTCAAALVIDAAVSDEVAAAVLIAWRARPFRGEAPNDAWRRLHAFRPKLFLELCRRAGGEPGDWLSEWGVASLWRDHPGLRGEVEGTLVSWLAATPLPAKLPGPADDDDPLYRLRNRERRGQQGRVRALARIGRLEWADLVGRERDPETPDAQLVALRVIAYAPIAPFVPALVAWALGGVMSGRRRHAALVAGIVRLNNEDGLGADAALAEAAEALAGRGDRRSRRAAAHLLEATGHPEHARRAAALWPRPAPAKPATLVLRDGLIEPAAPGPTARGKGLLRDLSSFALNPAAELSPAVRAAFDVSLRSVTPEDQLEAMRKDRDWIAAALRWAPETLAGTCETEAVRRAHDTHGDFEPAVRLLPVLSASALEALRAVRPGRGPGGDPDVSREVDWVALNLVGRSFAAQAKFLLGTERISWPKGFASLLNRPSRAQAERLLARINFRRPWEEIWRPVLLAIAVVEQSPRWLNGLDGPGLDWTAAFSSHDEGGVEQALRLASRLRSRAAAESLVRLGWRADASMSQPTRFLGSDVHLALPDDQLAARLEHLEPDAWFHLYSTRPSLKAEVVRVWRAWLERQLSKTEGGRVYGGEQWSYGDEQAAYDRLCTDDVAFVRDLLDRTWRSPERRRNIVWDHGHGPAWRLVRALAKHDPEFVARIWRGTVSETSGIRSSMIDHFPAELPRAPAFTQLRREMIGRAMSDQELLGVVLALEREGHGPWVADEIRAALDDPRPAVRAQAITMAGFLSGGAEDVLWSNELAGDLGPGWLSEVQSKARDWRDRARFMRSWMERAMLEDAEVRAWAAYALFARLEDSRASVWWSKAGFMRRRRDRRVQWLNYEGEGRRERRRGAGDRLSHSRFHTDLARDHLPPIPV